MKAAEEPLTARELARLLRAFAAMVERSADLGAPAPPPRAPRRGQRKNRSLPADVELTPAELEAGRQVARRAGLIP